LQLIGQNKGLSPAEQALLMRIQGVRDSSAMLKNYKDLIKSLENKPLTLWNPGTLFSN
jgi:hypothetical protein